MAKRKLNSHHHLQRLISYLQVFQVNRSIFEKLDHTNHYSYIQIAYLLIIFQAQQVSHLPNIIPIDLLFYLQLQQQKMRQSKQSTNNQSISPTLKNNRFEYKLKKQIDSKFNKKPRKDQINYSAQTIHRKSSSIMFNNPLTKSSFSLNDSITHKNQVKDALQPIKKAVKSMSSKKIIALSSRQKYPIFEENTFKTRAQAQSNEETEGKSKSHAKSLGKKYSCQTITLNRVNKFKLLIKERNSQYKSSSQRKISRIQSKIDILKRKKVFLESLIPIQKSKLILAKPPPKIYHIKDVELKQRIIKMSLKLIQINQLYFNMYIHSNIVGSHLKNIEGYNKVINASLMVDDVRAKRIDKPQQITSLFHVFKSNRKQNYLQEDMYLLNLLDIFLYKMERRYKQNLNNYNYHQNKKRINERQSLQKTRVKCQKKLGRHEQMHKINHFIQNRLRFNQNRREQYMQNLEKRGVILNIIQRSRQIILRQNENAVKNSL